MKINFKAASAVSAFAIISATSFAANAAVIEGRVSDQSKSISLNGAVVRIEETGASTSTNRAGDFRLNAVPAGEYNLTVSYLGAEPVTVTVTVPSADATVRQDITIGDDVAIEDNILVIGQRGSLNSALNRERSADDFRSVLSADAIGQFPDENVAEAARRAVGVNVLNDQGEGRFISIRGLDPNLSSTSINGVRIPSPEGGDRSVPLDVIDSDLLSAIVINKSLTPDVDGDSIGGNIEIETLSGLDRSDAFFKLKAAGTYANITDELGQKYAATYADNFLENTLGVAASISYRERNFGSDNKEVDDASWTIDGDEVFPDEFELRDYDITRERFSAALNLDYRPTDSLDLFVHSLFSRFEDQEFRSRIEAKYEDGEFASAANGVSFVNGTADDEFEVDRDIKDRLETQKIASVVTGGTWRNDALTVDFAGSYAYAEEAEPNRIDTAFRAKFDSGVFGVDISNPILPNLAFGDAASEAAFYDTDNYEFDELELVNGLTTDEEFAFNLDVQYDTELFGAPGYVKAGGKVRLREKDRAVDVEVFDGFDGAGFDTLTAFATPIDNYDLDNFGPAPDAGPIRDFFFDNRASFEDAGFDTIAKSLAEDYVAEEDIFAGYVMAKADFDKLRVVTGVRIEHTEFDATGNGIIEFETVFDGDVEDTVVPGDLTIGVPGAVLVSDLDADYDGDDDETTVEAIYQTIEMASQSYTDWLPSLNLRYEAQDNLIARLGYYKSIVRPNISAIVPAAEIAQDEDELEATLGNPDLERQRAHNVDASIAWYPNRDSVFQVGAFYKRINNFIAEQNFEDFEFNGATYEEATIHVNLDTLDLFGLEVNYQQQFSFLSEPFDGIIAGANYTFVEAEAEVALEDGTPRTIDLPQQSKHVANFVLGYDKGPIDLRAVATYRDAYLDEINFAGDGVDRIVEDHFQIDLSAKYKVTDQFKVYLDAKNVTNEPFIASISDGGIDRLNSQFEQYGYSIEFGVTFTY